jgi:hypothetical protein
MAAVLLALGLLAGCGGEEGGEPAAARSSATSAAAAPSSSAAPVYVETESCRAKMGPLVDIMLANAVDSLDYSSFDNRVDQLAKKIDAAVAPCSPEINGPARKVMYRFTLARAQWGIGKCDNACIEKVGDNIRAGLKLARKVDYQLDLTT